MGFTPQVAPPRSSNKILRPRFKKMHDDKGTFYLKYECVTAPRPTLLRGGPFKIVDL
jgi:hypothetical protein